MATLATARHIRRIHCRCSTASLAGTAQHSAAQHSAAQRTTTLGLSALAQCGRCGPSQSHTSEERSIRVAAHSTVATTRGTSTCHMLALRCAATQSRNDPQLLMARVNSRVMARVRDGTTACARQTARPITADGCRRRGPTFVHATDNIQRHATHHRACNMQRI
jgi:hypothetical protein